jgi:hypothetical protein
MSKNRSIQEIFMAGFLVLLMSGLVAADPNPQPPAKPQANWIKIESTPPFVMLADTDKLTMPLLVTLDTGVKASDVKLKLLGVRYEKLVDERLTDQFKVEEGIQESAARGPTLNIQVDLTKGLRPGNYELVVEASAPGKSPLRLSPVALEKQAVGFVQPSKLTIVQQYPFPLFGGKIITYPEQLLVDQASDSRFSRAKGVEFYPIGYRLGDGSPSPGKITPVINAILSPGKPLMVDLKLSDFPIGTSTGSMQIRGADLKEPKLVEVEVRTRRSPDWIWLMIIFGLLFGWFLRSFLQGRVELGQAKQEALKFMDSLPSWPDSEFQKSMGELKKPLQRALDQKDREQIVNKTKEAQEGLKTAIEKWEAGFKDTEQQLEDLSKSFNQQYHLPPRIAAPLDEARRSLEEARTCLKDQNVVRAKTVKDNTCTRLVSQVSQGIGPWKNDALKLLDSLSHLGFALDENQLKSLADTKDQLNGEVNNVQDPTAMEKVPEVFMAVHDLQGKLTSLLHWLSRQLEEGARNYGVLLKTRGLNDAEAIADLEKRAVALGQELDAAAIALDPAKPPYRAEASAELRTRFRDLLEQALTPVKEKMNADELQQITTATGNGRYFEAAGLLPVKTQPLGSNKDEFPGPSTIPPIFWQPKSEPPAGGEAVTQLVQFIKPLEPIEVMRARTGKELLWAKAAQTLIVGAAITVVGYLLFADNFVGTTKELATVFFWGFGLDVSMANLLGMAAKLPGPRK